MKRLLAKILAAIVITTTITNIGVSSNIYANTMYRNNQESTDKNEKWNLVWEDNFNGDYLNLQDWNYETHEPGWVNNELQEYTDDIRNIYVDNGNLVIKAIKEETEDGIKYTSGKVTTQNKHDYKYGRFEARLKVPEGQGLWPAFWMMPTEEELYGSWPRCGEIDIMEVLGHE
uniref:glycoside hydrolase family 16 protein n=2 Tax=Clostridium TaxID=1485 RepID=UPI0039E84361